MNRAGLLGNRYILLAVGLLVVFQMGFTYLAPMQTLFGTASIDAAIWAHIVLVASSVLVQVELEKTVFRRIGEARGMPLRLTPKTTIRGNE